VKASTLFMFGCLSCLVCIPSMTAPPTPSTHDATAPLFDENEREASAPATVEMEGTLEVRAADARPRSNNSPRRVATLYSPRTSDALSRLSTDLAPKDLNTTSLIGLLLRGMEYQAMPSLEGSLTTDASLWSSLSLRIRLLPCRC
jgi:hypothetical protein